MKEEFIEEGIVKRTFDNSAEIIISNKEECKECSAKIICKPIDNSDNLIVVKDPFGVEKGDIVRFSINGGNVLLATLKLYLIPLILFIAGLLFGYYTVENISNRELISFACGTFLTVIYFAVYSLLNKKSKPITPTIISVKKI